MANKYLEKIAASKKTMEAARLGIDALHLKEKVHKNKKKKTTRAKAKRIIVRKFARPNNTKK